VSSDIVCALLLSDHIDLAITLYLLIEGLPSITLSLYIQVNKGFAFQQDKSGAVQLRKPFKLGHNRACPSKKSLCFIRFDTDARWLSQDNYISEKNGSTWQALTEESLPFSIMNSFTALRSRLRSGLSQRVHCTSSFPSESPHHNQLDMALPSPTSGIWTKDHSLQSGFKPIHAIPAHFHQQRSPRK
jgi:hypothetical protein